ncbi:MAG TPA: ATP-grasp domain-containing protein [Rhodocyclaceae bacterium]
MSSNAQRAPRALLVGSSFSAAPMFFALKKRGLTVEVCGNKQSDPCHQYADASHYFDYSDRDALLKLVQAQRYDYLVPTCNDYSYLASTWVAAQLGYGGFDTLETAAILHTKHRFRAFTEAADLPAPRSRRQARGEHVDVSGLAYPLLVKPVDSFSGRGVTKVLAADQLAAAVAAAEAASRSGEIVIEEFVDGTLHSHSAFIRGGEIVYDVFVDEYCTVYPYQVNCSNHPSILPEATCAAMRASMQRLIAALGLADGLLHTQLIVSGERHWIIECMRRCPGDLYGGLIEHSTGINYTDMFVQPFIGETLTPRGGGPARPVGRHTISLARSLANYTFSQRIPAERVHTVPLKVSGERLDVAPYDKLAILFAEYADFRQMREVTPHLADYVSVRSLEELYG